MMLDYQHELLNFGKFKNDLLKLFKKVKESNILKQLIQKLFKYTVFILSDISDE